MKAVPGYTKVLTLGSSMTENALIGDIILQEKIDGCVVYDTSILLANGKRIPIGKIVENKLPVKVLSYNYSTNLLEPKKVSNWFKYKAKEEDFLEIITRGRVSSRKSILRVTPNHKIYTSMGYKLAGELKLEDILYSPLYRWDNFTYKPKGMSLLPKSIMAIRPVVSKPRRFYAKYDITVEDNHNYFAQNSLVSNSLFGFGRDEEGNLVARSKGVQQHLDAPDKMFTTPIKYIQSIKDKIMGMVYENAKEIYFYCEFLGKPKHNVLAYDHYPNHHLVLFDAMADGKWMPREDLMEASRLLEIDVIPELYRGQADVEKIKSLLTLESYLGKETLEGVVIKNYGQHIELGGHIYPLFTKYVREAFKERHSLEWKTKKPKGALEEFINGFRSEARWQKAVIHAKELGKLENSPRDIGMLMKMVQQDVEEEEAENIKEYAIKYILPEAVRHSTGGLAPWYKDKLLENLNKGGEIK